MNKTTEMHFHKKIMVLAAFLLILVFLPAMAPFHSIVLFSLVMAPILFLWITWLILTDETEEPNENRDKIPIP
jgi:hypothetical protein